MVTIVPPLLHGLADPGVAAAGGAKGGGHGLAGMRERVGALGGDLTAGPARDGGYEVHAVLPLRARVSRPGGRQRRTVGRVEADDEHVGAVPVAR